MKVRTSAPSVTRAPLRTKRVKQCAGERAHSSRHLHTHTMSMCPTLPACLRTLVADANMPLPIIVPMVMPTTSHSFNARFNLS